MGELCSTSGRCHVPLVRMSQVESSGGVKQMIKTITALKNAKAAKAEGAETLSAKLPRKKSSIVPASDVLDEVHIRRVPVFSLRNLFLIVAVV